MKNELSNLIRQLKKLTRKKKIIPSSVRFETAQSNYTVGDQRFTTDFFQELKEAVSSGNDTIWRLWR